jgi:predicted membrane-bound spermidine synthase
MPLRVAVFLITLSGLVFEIALTRIYSATIWYHFTFVAVSVALLGWGLGGLTVHLTKKRSVPSHEKAAIFCVLYSVTILLTLGLIVKFPFTIDRMPLYFVAPFVPFLLAGMALAMIFDLHRQIATTLYFFDLIGASLGALAVTFLLQILGGEATVLVAAITPLLAAAALSRRLRLVGVAGAVLLTVAALTNERTGLFRVIPGSLKAMRRQMDQNPSTRVTQTGWNAYSRIDAVEGLPAPNLARLYIDSDAWTSVHRWDGNLESVRDMKDWYRALPFKFAPNADTLIIGPGGGADVLAALASGSRKVTAVELNPLMLKFVRHYGSLAGNIYDRPDVEVIQSEGRNFISRTDRKFDIILLGFVDSWASVASGGLSLSENYLYTTQAFRAYYDHLKDDGMLVIIRWDADIPRLVSNSVALLGPSDAASRVVVLMEKRESKPDEQSQMIFMLRRRPFTPAETNEIVTNWTLARPVIVPDRITTSPYTYLLNGSMTPTDWDAQSRTRIGPVFDDSPFYFAIERPWGMATRIARMLFQVLVFPSFVLLALFVAFGKPSGRPVGSYAGSIVYFAALGFGFITVELALLQNLTLLLGHPIFTLSVLLFTLLAAGGIGSALSRHFSMVTACLVVGVLGTVEAFGLPRLVPMLLPLSLPARVVIAVLLIAPLGLAMGMPFPRGLQKAGQGSLPAPPFYWGLNGIMSVLGSISTVVVALTFGFRAAMLIGSACYLLASLAAGTLDPVSVAAPAPEVERRPGKALLANRLPES